MADYKQVKQDYNRQAFGYDEYLATTPIGRLESQLFDIALGRCPGAIILDLGGGTGQKARRALAQGAESVHVVDISRGMISKGQEIERKLGFHGSKARISWYEADVSQPLDQQDSTALLSPASYDIILGCWIFGHAATETMLEAMWHNVATYLKPGGLFVGERGGHPFAKSLASEKYGCTLRDFEKIQGGWRYHYLLHTKPLLDFEYNGLESVWMTPFKLPMDCGLVNLVDIPTESARVVHDEPEFYQDFVDKPGMILFTGRMKK